jgi:type IV pilus assembly protein PilY1
MKKLIFLSIIMVSISIGATQSRASDTDLFTTQANANILIILDNSNSMDEDFWGNAVGSYSPASKSVVGKKALRDIMNRLSDKVRLGLMTYTLSGVSAQHLQNLQEFVSYDPKSYCPNPPPECVTYAQTGDSGAKSVCTSGCQADNPLFDPDYFDEIISNYPIGSEPRDRYSRLVYPHTQRMANPTDPSNYLYFKHAYPFYTGSDYGTAFCYGTGYSPNEGNTDSYTCYTVKTGTNDDYSSGYSGSSFGMSLFPTDSDIALGYGDFGKRLAWYHVGLTWFSNGSPGSGYLRVPVDDLLDHAGNTTATFTNLWNKLDPKENDQAGYMSYTGGDKNTSPYIINAGLTPTAGAFQKALDYFKGDTSPIQAWCQKNYILYVTDGLPSVNESGAAQPATSLMPTVLGKIDTLRNIVKTISGTDYNFDVKTYVLGVGLSDEAKLELDNMAVHGGTDAGGRAYYADKPSDLADALGKIFTDVISSAYSFASPSIPSVRMLVNDVLYISSFIPDRIPFWAGSLKAYQLNADGTLPVDANGYPLSAPIWQASIPASRTIKTDIGSALEDFNNSNLTPADLGVADNATRNALVSFIRTRPLGDIFHSNSVIVGAPNVFYDDTGFSGSGGFYQANKDRTKMVIVGANDGMLHAFNATTGVEEWAFIPSSVWKNLQLLTPTVPAPHPYFVDSSPKVADVWFYSDPSDTTKSADEWRTVLVCGLRKGGKTYFALDITDPSNPVYLWQFPKSTDAATLAIVGQSWSEPYIGRVKIEKNGGLVERWVAFIGGGYDLEYPGKDADFGRAFFVVDIKTGDIIWKFSYIDPHVRNGIEENYMIHAFPSAPTPVDTNSDGYLDRVYIGDLGGQMWVFDLSFNEITNKSDSLWSGKRLFTAPATSTEKHMIYYQPSVAFDQYRKPWVYWGTGDREDPRDWSNPPERFYAVIDNNQGPYPRTDGDLTEVTPDVKNTFTPALSKYGWYFLLERSGRELEKVLARPAVFDNLVYFTTYTYTPAHDLCSVAGISKEYIVEYRSGGGALNVDDLSDLSGPTSERSRVIGTGAPSPPVISVSVKGGASVIIGATSGQVYSKKAFSSGKFKDLLYWREVIP